MDVLAAPLPALDATFARDLPELCTPWRPVPVAAPGLVVLNEALAADLGLDPEALRGPDGVAVLSGTAVPADATPVAMAYAGHQFGGFSPRLGDGRAVLLGEIVADDGTRRDLHLKGSGRTPFARGGDGRAALGPMLREHLVSEAMHALGIPTTRSLAVTRTGEQVARDDVLPGAVLARVAASHIRVGTFQYAALQRDDALLRRLVGHTVRRHHPEAADAERPALALLEAVTAAQADLVARWMLVGFVHGVMNTDNMAISGETIDYGPCAFLDAYDPATVFSSIDHGGRYAYGNQPRIAQWDLARLAETLLPLIDDDAERAVEIATGVLEGFAELYRDAAGGLMVAKLGLAERRPGDDALGDGWLDLLQARGADMTLSFRALSAAVRGDRRPAHEALGDAAAFDAWAEGWTARLAADGRDAHEVAAAMDAVNPVHVPRNHAVEAALVAATEGDMGPFHRVLDAVTSPFEARPDLADLAGPGPDDDAPYVTFCGT